MKRSILRIVSILMVFALCLPYANAITIESGQLFDDALYVQSASCPSGYIEFANNNIGRFLAGTDPNELPQNGIITVGQPFCFMNVDSDIFYFPILCNNEIIFLLRVYPGSDAEYHGVLSKHLVNELNTIMPLTSYSSPLKLFMDGNDIKAFIGTASYTIFSYPEGYPNSAESASICEASVISPIQTTNILQENTEIPFSISADVYHNVSVPFVYGYPDSMYLATAITETQGAEHWCNAYATAFIVRYIKRNNGDDTSALDVMRYFYSYPANTDTLSVINTIEYANYRAIYPTYIRQGLPYTEMMEQITLYQPVFICMSDTLYQGDGHSYHAVVLRGYNYTIGTWSIWNPWYYGFETWFMNDTYTPSGNDQYEYEPYSVIYDWME